MSNQLKVAMIETILSLRQRGWSQRRIARELGIDRQTVARYLHQQSSSAKPAIAPLGSADEDRQAKPANAPLGSPPRDERANPAIAPLGSIPLDNTADQEPLTETEQVSRAGRASDCLPWRAIIQTKLESGLSAQRIYQDLLAEHGFTGSYYSVRRFVRHLDATQPLPFRRLECAPGEEAQVDFGSGAPVLLADGKRRRTHVFRIVLSHSRKAYSEAVYRQSTDDFLRCLENALWHFGGVPQRLILDNLRAAVRKADWYDPDLNPKVRSFGQHYGVVLWPTRPYTPRHKGKVERGVDYVQENALKGRTFASLEEQNRFLLAWEGNVADTRLHGTTRRQVGSHFLTVERLALQPLPGERFPCFQEVQRLVHRDGHVEVDKAYYSVPPEYLARRVWVRWDARLVRIFNERLEQIALHIKHEPGRFSTQSQHIAGPKISGVERGAAWLLGQVRRLGPHSLRWAEAMIQARGVEGVRVLQGLLNLAHRHSGDAIERACDIALSYGAYRLQTLRALLDRHASRQEHLPFIQEHSLIRPLSDYGHFVHEAFQKEVQP
jgi:transposase